VAAKINNISFGAANFLRLEFMLETLSDFCPYCGERIELVVDCSIPEQSYIEDCSVCCHPMVVIVTATSEDLQLTLLCEDEASIP
jgi:hypothetical protein